jgi:trehalose 6-phosphate phosphatase
MMPLPTTTVHSGNQSPERGGAPPASLPAEPGWALFLDLDGTLCGYELDPDQVELDAAQREVLGLLSRRTGGAVCILSGRSSGDLQQRLDGLPIVWRGDHGHDGETLTDAVAQALGAAAHELAELAARHPGAWLERKPAACALHYRATPHSAESLIRALRPLADRWPELRLLEGQCVLELLPARASKGAALRQLMARPPFAGRVPVVAGDDVTDEDAFVAALGLGGFGIAVGPRPSVAARFHLADTAALNSWLRGLAYPAAEQVDA